MTRPVVSVIVVSWNRRDCLERCLEALRADASGPAGPEEQPADPAAGGGWREVIVVDNASTDGSPELVRERFPEARLITLRRNTGFAAANTIGAAHSRGRYLLLLNSDAYVRPGAISALCACLDAHPEVAVVGPQLRYPDGRLQPSGRAFPTLWTALRALLPGAPPARERADYAVPADVDEVSAAAMLVRRAALRPGEPLFDPAFRFFGEDVDLCWRLRRRGWRVRYWPAAVVEHEWGASRGRLGHARTALLAQRGYLLLLRRHRPAAEAAALRCLLLPITALKLARWLLDALRARDLAAARDLLGLARSELTWLLRSPSTAHLTDPAGASAGPGLDPDTGGPSGAHPADHAKRPLRLTLVTGAWPPDRCGVGDYTATLARHLARLGARIVVVTSRRDAFADGGEVAGQVAQAAVESGNPFDAAVVRLRVMRSWGVQGAVGLLRAVLGARPDVVHIQYPTVGYGRGLLPNLLPWLLKLVRPRLPVVTSVHEYLSYRRAGRARILIGAAGSAAVVCPDPANAAALARWRPLVPRTEVIPIGPAIEPASPPDPARRRALRGSVGVGEADCLAVYFGFVTRSKGVATLLRATAMARRSLEGDPAGPRLRLVLLAAPVANDPAEAGVVEAVLALWRTLGGESLAHWAGDLPAETVSAWLSAADLAVLPFADGASPRRTTLLAALAHGLPVISTRPPTGAEGGVAQPPPPSASTWLEALQLVPPEDPAALAEAMVTLARDRERRAALARRSGDLALGYDWPRIARQTCELYRRVVDARYDDPAGASRDGEEGVSSARSVVRRT